MLNKHPCARRPDFQAALAPETDSVDSLPCAATKNHPHLLRAMCGATRRKSGPLNGRVGLWRLGSGAPLCGQHLDLQAALPGMEEDLRSLAPAEALPLGRLQSHLT